MKHLDTLAPPNILGFIVVLVLSISGTMFTTGSGVQALTMSTVDIPSTTTPRCTQKLLWYTKGTQVCAPTTIRGTYKWQTILKQSDTTAFMKTCRSFFSTSAGLLLCDWMQKYVNNVITIKGPKDNCLTYWKNLLNHAARVAQTTKSATVGTAIEPFAARNSWVCHP
jgi:hypothetical protein